MSKLNLFFIFLFIAASSLAQENQLKGYISNISTNKLITIIPNNHNFSPATNQQVIILKPVYSKKGKLKNNVKSAHGIVIEKINSILKVRLIEYVNEKVEKGKIVPLIKKNDNVIVRWKEEMTKADSYYPKAFQLKEQRKYKEAISFYNKIITDTPKHHWALFDRGVCYYHLKNYALAEKDLSAAYILNPNSIRVLIKRADVYEALKNFKRAIADIELLLKKQLTDELKLDKNKQLIELKIKDKDNEGACKIINTLKVDFPEDFYFQNAYNKNCAIEKAPVKPTNRLDLKIISQSKDGNTMKAKVLDAPAECFAQKISYSKYNKLKPGTITRMATCRKNASIMVAALKVKSVEAKTVEFEVYYWLNMMKRKPVTYSYKEGDIIVVMW